MTEHSTDLVVPWSGAVVNFEDAAEVAMTLADVRDIEGRIRDFKRDLTAALVYHSEQYGAKTLHMGELEVTVATKRDVSWNTEKLQRDLASAGMPQERIDQLILTEVSYKVVAAVANQIAKANPRYAAVIEACRSYGPETISASVKRK